MLGHGNAGRVGAPHDDGLLALLILCYRVAEQAADNGAADEITGIRLRLVHGCKRHRAHKSRSCQNT